jgi:hypothetical protein
MYVVAANYEREIFPMKAIVSHILRSAFRPKPGPQSVGVYVADANQRPEIVKRSSTGGTDSNRYFGQYTSVRVVTADVTLTAQDDGAHVIIDSADPVVVSLPATSAGLKFTVSVKQADNAHAVNPVAADKIFATGITAEDNKDLLNSTSTVGASIVLEGDGVDGYFARVTGTWTREA